MWSQVNFRLPIFLCIATAVFAGFTVSRPVSSGSKNVPPIEIGTRRAATALLTGTYPKQWTMRAGGTIPPKSLAWPIPGRHLGRGFASDNGRHQAVDITTPEGTKVRAAEQGIVGYASNEVKGYGNLLMIVHPGGFVTLYGHLSGFKVKPGRLVSRNQVVALTGNTGISKGPHLHMALFINGKASDPLPFMKDVPKSRIARLFSLTPFL
jgi:murein DD-endopeptidase MepM/ murein hydrolase activator NlpD